MTTEPINGPVAKFYNLVFGHGDFKPNVEASTRSFSNASTAFRHLDLTTSRHLKLDSPRYIDVSLDDDSSSDEIFYLFLCQLPVAKRHLQELRHPAAQCGLDCSSSGKAKTFHDTSTSVPGHSLVRPRDSQYVN